MPFEKSLLASACALLMVVVLIGGCSDKRALVGTWTAEVVTPGGNLPAEHQMNADKTFTTTFSLPGQEGSKVIVIGNYTLENETLTFSPKDARIEGMEGLAAAFAEQYKPRFLKPQIVKIRWNSDDEFVTRSDNAPSVTFKRKQGSVE
jgi:hypothetical protein